MPKSKQYLIATLSVFFSFGSVAAAIVGLLVIPQNSCLPGQACDVDKQNQGWRYLFIVLGVIVGPLPKILVINIILCSLVTQTLAMFLARIFFFRLHESPRY
jgi:MFS family permease